MKIEHKSLTTSKGVADVYKLTNASGASVVLSSIGAGIVEVNVPDAHNAISNVALGYKNLEDYLYDGPCMGKTPGVMPIVLAVAALQSTALTISSL